MASFRYYNKSNKKRMQRSLSTLWLAACMIIVVSISESALVSAQNAAVVQCPFELNTIVYTTVSGPVDSSSSSSSSSDDEDLDDSESSTAAPEEDSDVISSSTDDATDVPEDPETLPSDSLTDSENPEGEEPENLPSDSLVDSETPEEGEPVAPEEPVTLPTEGEEVVEEPSPSDEGGEDLPDSDGSSTPAATRRKRRYLQVVEENSETTEEGDSGSSAVVVAPGEEEESTEQQPTNTTTTTTILESSNEQTILNCDVEFYSAWNELGILCNGTELEPELAAAAASCNIYSGTLNDNAYADDMTACMQICSFPTCDIEAGVWDYSSSVRAFEVGGGGTYDNMDLGAIIGQQAILTTNFLTNNSAGGLSNVTFTSEYDTCLSVNLNVSDFENFFDNDECQDTLVCPESLGSVLEEEVSDDEEDYLKSIAAVSSPAAAAAGESAAVVTVGTGVVIAIASSGSGVQAFTTATTVSVGSGVSTSLAMGTLEFCQFTTMLGQVHSCEEGDPFCEYTDHFGGSTFLYLKDFIGASSYDSRRQARRNRRRRLQESSGDESEEIDSVDEGGVEAYAERLDIAPEWLLYITLAGVAGIGALIFLIYILALIVTGLCGKSVKVYAVKWWDNVIGLYVLVGILTQYAIGVTATYEIVVSIQDGELGTGLFVAVASLIVLALGIIFYGVYVVRKNELEIRDVGTYEHTKKSINKRYGALYDEYVFEKRYFFAPKMTLAFISGVTTGLALLSSIQQVIVLVVLHIGFLFYLEMQRPYQTKFLQNTASLVTVMKIAALVLTFFLLSAINFFPDDLKTITTYVVIAIQLGVLLCLLFRQMYIAWKRYQSGIAEKKRLSATSTENGPVVLDASEAFSPNYHHSNSNDSSYYYDEKDRSEYRTKTKSSNSRKKESSRRKKQSDRRGRTHKSRRNHHRYSSEYDNHRYSYFEDDDDYRDSLRHY